ncbi:hypothetical protein QLQ12_06895 [Actinoplanes sp. NEAU-A12]|uniref:Uncharacterized protein n=1 Tax=Actinoplanes sandaracinus TaxID=3045177 RepID=A0ABT6WF44_9ACTN|nr:hypothetical protein [Actinoplanes sandaracinus]MDI6098327.1 hypothetical protein [Actinoplanes sandaracinus]
MTTSPQPEPAAEKPLGQFLRPLRDLAVYALLGAPAVFLFVAVVNLLGADFAGRAQGSFGGFVNLETVFFPLAAVLLALGVTPVHPKARLITLVAVVEYGVASFFGVIFGVLFGVSHLAASSAVAALGALLARVAWLGLLALAGYAVLQIWLGVFSVPRPKPQPGVYGQPYGQAPYGQPSYGQPPFGQAAPYGQPPFGAPSPGQQQFGAPVSGQQQFGAPGTAQPQWGSPGSAPPQFGAPGPVPPPVATQPFNVPSPATYGQYPAVPPPGWGQPPVPPAEPTQQVPKPVSTPPAASPPPIDRTAVLPEDRPGFGPAAEDPPRQ